MIPDEVRDYFREALIADKRELLDLRDSPFVSNADIDRDLAKNQAALNWLDNLPQLPEPDWSQAPEGAMWWTVNANGYREWSQCEPYADEDDGQWRTYEGIVWEAGEERLDLGIDWRTLKRKRPEAGNGTE